MSEDKDKLPVIPIPSDSMLKRFAREVEAGEWVEDEVDDDYAKLLESMGLVKIYKRKEKEEEE